MAHFAKLDKNNVVTEVIVAEQDFINSGKVGDSFLWVQTSYNNNFRKHYAGIGFTYDHANDVFYAPQPYPSWTLNETTWTWDSPVPMPEDDKFYTWDEDTTNWIEVTD